MELYGSYTSPYVRHCRIVIGRTGQDCRFIVTDYAASAAGSPAMRVPYLRDGALQLTDSTSILRYLRERAGQPFLANVTELDFFLLVNTALDSCVNLFLLERDGITPAQSPYLARQQQRVSRCLQHLEALLDLAQPDSAAGFAEDGDALLRLGCFLSWALFRERIDLQPHRRLSAFRERFDANPEFAASHPSRSA